MKRISLTNHTTDILVCHVRVPAADPKHFVLSPEQSITTDLCNTSRNLTLSPGSLSSEKEWEISPNSFTVRLPMSLAATWKVVKVADDCPWRVYCSKVSRKNFRLTVIPRRNLASFLSEMPDSLPLSSLLLPGTHDTMALYGWPISQCQSLSTPLEVQLHWGIRVLDVRLAVVDGRLIAYHGIYPERAPFGAILATLHAFLTAPTTRRETLVVSIKQEDFASVPPARFSALVRAEMLAGPGGAGVWFLEDRIPLLGEVRGRAVLFSRFEGDGAEWDGGLGIHPRAWPDSARGGFAWQCGDTHVRTHDWYNIPSFLAIPEKTTRAAALLVRAREPPAACPTLAISFFSASSVPLAFPPTIARGFGWPSVGLGVEGVNRRLGRWLLDMLAGPGAGHGPTGEKAGEEARLRGWALLDFYRDPEDNGVVPLLVECNFRGRKEGEEGWPRDAGPMHTFAP